MAETNQALQERKQQLIDELDKAASRYKERKASGKLQDLEVNQDDLKRAVSDLLTTYQNKLASVTKQI